MRPAAVRRREIFYDFIPDFIGASLPPLPLPVFFYEVNAARAFGRLAAGRYTLSDFEMGHESS